MTDAPAYFSRNGWNINASSGSEVWASHVDAEYRPHFLARFKYARAASCARHFIRFVTARWTPAAWYAMDAKAQQEALKAAGYVHYNILHAFKRHGFDAQLQACGYTADQLRAAIAAARL